MKEIITQKPLRPVLHGFLLKDRKFVPASKSKVLNIFGLFETGSIKSEETWNAGTAVSRMKCLIKHSGGGYILQTKINFLHRKTPNILWPVSREKKHKSKLPYSIFKSINNVKFPKKSQISTHEIKTAGKSLLEKSLGKHTSQNRRKTPYILKTYSKTVQINNIS